MYPSAFFSPKSSSLVPASSINSSNNDEQLAQQQVFAQPSFTHYQTPNRTQAKSFMLSPSFADNRITLFPTGSVVAGIGGLESPPFQQRNFSFIGRKGNSKNFDLLTFLSPEISVKILLYLHPLDICNASAVSIRWYQLTLHKVLHTKRKHYILCKSEEYKKSKENYCGRSPSHPCSASHMTVAPAPLNVIQPTEYNQHSPSPISPNTSRSHTPSPTFLVEDVNRLSLEDHQEITIRRSLFVDFPLSPVAVGDSCGRTFQSAFCSLRKEVAGRKLNKNRLRRL